MVFQYVTKGGCTTTEHTEGQAGGAGQDCVGEVKIVGGERNIFFPSYPKSSGTFVAYNYDGNYSRKTMVSESTP